MKSMGEPPPQALAGAPAGQQAQSVARGARWPTVNAAPCGIRRGAESCPRRSGRSPGRLLNTGLQDEVRPGYSLGRDEEGKVLFLRSARR